MQITRNGSDTNQGPADWFTGAVYLDQVAAPSGSTRVNASSVHFTPGARTAWHTHPNGQTIYVTEGRGVVQSRGASAVVVGAGDVVHTPPDEWHWHGAAADHFMAHLSITEAAAPGSGKADSDWGDHVTDEEYGAAQR